MEDFQLFYEGLRAVWRGWFPDPFVRGWANAGVFLGFFYLVVLAIERFHGTRTRNYRRREFAWDVAYYLYYRSGTHRILFTLGITALLSRPLSFLDLGLLRPLPLALEVGIGLVVADMAMYWLHRAQHHFRFLWAFHTTHHSPEQLTFATFNRFHPVEVAIGDIVSFALLSVLGADFSGWVLIYLISTFFGEIQHSQIPWSLGPLRRIIVSPRFHAYHHSPDRATHDRNFGGFFAFWDHLFGTAVPDGTPAPTTFGLPDVKPQSLLGTLTTPFVLLWRWYGPQRTAGPAGPAETPCEPEAALPPKP